MKRYLIYLGGVLLALTLITFAKAPKSSLSTSVSADPATIQPETALPTEAATPAPAAVRSIASTDDAVEDEPILGWCRSIADALPFLADLDGDGVPETVDLTILPGADDQGRWTLSLQKGDQVTLFQTDVPEDTSYGLWAGDLDEDGQYELFFHGDLASNDYVIYGFRSDLSCLFFEPDERAFRWGGNVQSSVFDGYIEGFEDGHLVISGAVDMLGTHWGVRTFAIGDDGIIGPVSTVWQFIDEAEADTPLVVTKALTAYKASVRKDPGEAFILEPGERIYLLASDGWERMWFETEKGKGGVLLLTPDEENTWLIDGVPESEYFEFLPYAG